MATIKKYDEWIWWMNTRNEYDEWIWWMNMLNEYDKCEWWMYMMNEYDKWATQYHDSEKSSLKAIARNTSTVNIDLESIPTKPTRLANDIFLSDLIGRDALVSDQLDQRSSSSQTLRTIKNLPSDNYLLSTVSMHPTMPTRLPIMICCLTKISIFINFFQLILTKSCNAYQQIMQVGKRRLPTDPDSVCRPSAVVSLRYSCENCCVAKRKCVPSKNPGLPCKQCYERKLLCFNAESQQGKRNNLGSNNYLQSTASAVVPLATQHHDGKKSSQKAIVRKASPVNIYIARV